ncbi:FAD-dependent oxidoreductase [Mycobacterium sp. NPDC051804]|uniref:FAD-dependent oxidoreductase n=1 Tax=Mycobacterium sp. NPDC051804 TaxID=3364295 RepID=UPI00379055F4
MFTSIPALEQYDQAGADELRVLVIGAGIAGVTAAQLLRKQGRHPVVIERASGASAAGYMLALMPMVDGAIDDLGVRERYRASSVSFERYAVHGHTGRLLREDSMAEIIADFGDYRGIARGALLDVLSADGCPVTFDSTITEVRETSHGVEVGVATAGGTQHLEFDLVVIADGMGSTARQLVPAYQPIGITDTKWGGWVVWAPIDEDSDLGEEVWGDGFFIGMYPVAGQLGIFLGGPRADTAVGPAPFVEWIRGRLSAVNPRIAQALTAVAGEPDPYYWSLTDCRAPAWTTDRTVLLGDAAAGFLPTAGVGAGMAMESAWVLARMLQHADTRRLSRLLRAYERSQRPRVEAAQDNSRQLAKLMLHRSTSLACAREIVMRFVSVERALRPIQRLLQEQPDPDVLVREAAGTT